MHILIAGGGTGGHLFPGIAVAQEIKRRHPEAEVLFVGTERGIEFRAVPKAGFELAVLPVIGLRGIGWRSFLSGLLRLPLALWRALTVVRRFSPDVAVSCGGYAAGPAIVACRLLGVRCVVLEQNAVPGVTNRLLGLIARHIIAGLPVRRGFQAHKVMVAGNPVRADFLPVRARPYQPHLPLRVLVVGGSQGARALNDAMIKAAPLWRVKGLVLEVVHQTGVADAARVAEAYAALGLGERVQVAPFIDDMAAALERCDVVVCRAGASTIAELTVCGRPAILVPFPQAADDHQTANARTLADAGAAVLLAQSELSPERLLGLFEAFSKNPAKLVSMAEAAHQLGKPQAVETITDVLEQEAGGV